MRIHTHTYAYIFYATANFDLYLSKRNRFSIVAFLLRGFPNFHSYFRNFFPKAKYFNTSCICMYVCIFVPISIRIFVLHSHTHTHIILKFVFKFCFHTHIFLFISLLCKTFVNKIFSNFFSHTHGHTYYICRSMIMCMRSFALSLRNFLV